MGPGTTLDPRSPQARAIADLFGETMILCAAIFVLVVALVGYALWRFRDKDGTKPLQSEGTLRLEIAWTAGPLLLLVGIFV